MAIEKRCYRAPTINIANRKFIRSQRFQSKNWGVWDAQSSVGDRSDPRHWQSSRGRVRV